MGGGESGGRARSGVTGKRGICEGRNLRAVERRMVRNEVGECEMLVPSPAFG